MSASRSHLWRNLAARQAGMLSRAQLNQLGFTKDTVNTHLRAERWQQVSSTVLSVTTGRLGRDQLMWAGVLHAGPDSAIGGLTALEVHGLRNWHRDGVTVLVAKSHNLEPMPGVEFVETRRDIETHRGLGRLPVWRVEPAALLFAAYEPVTRTAYGLLSAVVQQRLTDPDRLVDQLGRMRPLRRAKAFRRVLGEIDGGAQSLAELDVSRMCRRHGLPRPRRQVRRRDSSGRWRYTDAEWRLPDGRVVILEVDGAFHMDVTSWADDIERERGLVGTGVLVLRCTSTELRDDDARVVRDLKRVGVGRSSA
jgi:very-short-patch-repair endonuclease